MNTSPPIGNAPVVALSESQITSARQAYEGRVGEASIDKRRYFLWAVVMTATTLGLVASIVVILPLKTIQTHVIEVNKGTGEVKASGSSSSMKNYQPGDAERTYWLNKFATHLFEIDPRRDVTDERLQIAISMTRGKAAEQATDYLRKTTPIKLVMEDPSFSRRITVRAINFIRNTQTATVHIRVTDQSLGRKAEIKNYIVRCDYAFVAPETEKAVYQNPLGMFVIDFSVAEDA